MTAYQTSENELFKQVAEGIITYLLRDMSHESGAFFSAEDADSLPTADSAHKKEGAFYVWTRDDIEKVDVCSFMPV